jgi:hypothetical protein
MMLRRGRFLSDKIFHIIQKKSFSNETLKNEIKSPAEDGFMKKLKLGLWISSPMLIPIVITTWIINDFEVRGYMEKQFPFYG